MAATVPCHHHGVLGFVFRRRFPGRTRARWNDPAGLAVWIELAGLVCFRVTVVVWHQTWAVNSVTHIWGYRNYETGEDSRNNVFVGLLSNGEGWHNNHHADSRSARHGHLPWEIDTTYWILLLLQRLGLVYNIRRPTFIRRMTSIRKSRRRANPVLQSKIVQRPYQSLYRHPSWRQDI